MTRVLTTTNMLKMLCQKPKATSNNKNSSKQEKRCLFSVCTSHRAETTSPSPLPSLNLAPFVTICENVRKYFKNVFSTSMAALHFGTRRTCRCSCRVAPARPRERNLLSVAGFGCAAKYAIVFCIASTCVRVHALASPHPISLYQPPLPPLALLHTRLKSHFHWFFDFLAFASVFFS